MVYLKIRQCKQNLGSQQFDNKSNKNPIKKEVRLILPPK